MLRHRIAMVGVFFAVLGGTVYMYGIVPKGFIPDEDKDFLFVNMRAAQGTSFYDMSTGMLRAAEIIRQNPNVDSFVVNTGGGNNGANQGRIQIQLLPRADRQESAQLIAQKLRPQLLRFPNYRAFVNIPPSLQIGGRVGNSSYSVTVQSANTDELYLWAQRLSNAMSDQVPEIQDVSNDLEIQESRRSTSSSIETRRPPSASTRPKSKMRSRPASARSGRPLFTARRRSTKCWWSSTPKYQRCIRFARQRLTFKAPRGAHRCR